MKDNRAQLDRIAILPAGHHRNLGLPCERSMASQPRRIHIACNSMEHHSTNGWNVDGRCVVRRRTTQRDRTTSFRQLPARSTNWLAAQDSSVDIERARQLPSEVETSRARAARRSDV